MKNSVKNSLYLTLLIIVLVIIMLNSNLILNQVIFAIDLWIHKVFPSLFPFFIISNFLINYGLVDILGYYFHNIMNKLFKIKGETAFVFFMAILSGFPSNAKYTKEMLNNGYINNDEATKILSFSCFSNPLFITNMVLHVFGHLKYGLIILLAHYLGNIFVGLTFRNYKPSHSKKKIKSISNIFNEIDQKNKSFGQCFANSLESSINTLLLILGTITSFIVISAVINEIVALPPLLDALLKGMLELTQGLNNLKNLPYNESIKGILFVSFLSFSGFSVHMQIKSIINDTLIKFKLFFIARIFHVTYSIIIFIVLMKLSNYIPQLVKVTSLFL